MDKTKQREEFEAAWLKRTGFAPVRAVYGDGYYYADQQSAWWAWQEVLVSVEIERPDTTCVGWVKEAIHEHDDKWIETIKAAGLRVKS